VVDSFGCWHVSLLVVRRGNDADSRYFIAMPHTGTLNIHSAGAPGEVINPYQAKSSGTQQKTNRSATNISPLRGCFR
jgi:hypothetical protein